MTIYRRLSYFIFCAFVLYGCFYIFYGETLPASVNEGFGWDGKLYGETARNFQEIMVQRKINRFHFQRILPSGVIYYALKFSSSSFTSQNIIDAFDIYNFILVLISLVLCFKISKKLELPDTHLLLGLISLVFSFPLIKLNFYYPVLTDATAFFIGMLALWAYVNKNKSLLIICSLFGSFTWPIILFAIPFLMIFTEDPPLEIKENKEKFIPAFSFSLLFTVIAIGIQIKYLHLFFNLSLLLITGILSFGVLVFILIGEFLRIDIPVFLQTFFSKTIRKINWKWLTINILLIAMVKITACFYEPPLMIGFKGYIIRIFSFATKYPFYPVISHLIYYGPVFFIILYFWKFTVRIIVRSGFGLTCFFLINLVQVFDPESRHIIFFLPFLIFYTLLALKEFKITNTFLISFFIIAILASKVWLKINTPDFIANIGYTIYYDAVRWDPQAIQTLYMNLGTFMTLNSYLIQSLVILLCAGILYLVHYKNKVESNTSI